MRMTIIYFNTCRRERLRCALTHVINVLGPCRTAAIVDGLQHSYKTTRSTRINYNYALHALKFVVGLQGLAAVSLLKEAWVPGSLLPAGADNSYGGHEQDPIATITHPSTNTTQ